MVQITPVDLPRAFMAASQVRGQQYQNQMAKMGMERMGQMNRLAPLAARGDESAISEMYGVNPEWAAKMDDRQKAQALEGVRDILAMMLVSDTPEKYEAALDQYASEGVDVEKYRGRFADRPLMAGRLKAQLGEMGGGGKFGRPQAGLGPGGDPAFFQTDPAGGVREVEGYTPMPKGPLVEVKLPGQPQIGTIPPGYEAIQDKKTKAWSMRPIAGGPVETKLKAEEEAAATKKMLKNIQADIVVEDIARSIKMIEEAKFPITAFGSLLSSVPGTAAHDLSERLGTIKANIGFDRLQSMRDASPTGGALGQVSEFENKMLQATYGALAQSQSKEELLFNLRRLNETYLDIIHGSGNRPGKDAKAVQGGKSGFGGMTDEEFSAAPLTGDNAAAWMEEAKKRGLVP